MKIFRELNEVQSDFGDTVLTVGNFDGVHRAHQELLQAVTARARALAIRSIALTFHPHPTQLLRPDRSPVLLTSLDEKLRLMEQVGIDAALVLPFTWEFSQIEPHDFACQILGSKLRAREVHVGTNFRFGRHAEGTADLLADFGQECGFSVRIYPQMHFRGEEVSSSRIRKLLQQGDVSKARQLLGRPFSMTGTPEAGRGYGSQRTVPTLNLRSEGGTIVGSGVYITRNEISAACFNSITNVGIRPTFGQGPLTIESHLFDFHAMSLPEETSIKLFFLHRVRDEIQFASAEVLRTQILKDVQRAKRWFEVEGCISRRDAATGKLASVVR